MPRRAASATSASGWSAPSRNVNADCACSSTNITLPATGGHGRRQPPPDHAKRRWGAPVNVHRFAAVSDAVPETRVSRGLPRCPSLEARAVRPQRPITLVIDAVEVPLTGTQLAREPTHGAVRERHVPLVARPGAGVP